MSPELLSDGNNMQLSMLGWKPVCRQNSGLEYCWKQVIADCIYTLCKHNFEVVILWKMTTVFSVRFTQYSQRFSTLDPNSGCQTFGWVLQAAWHEDAWGIGMGNEWGCFCCSHACTTESGWIQVEASLAVGFVSWSGRSEPSSICPVLNTGFIVSIFWLT